MGYQRKPGWCGPAALQNALQIHGVRIGQGRLANLVDTCDDGTDETGMIAGLDRLGCQWHEIETDRKADAREWLIKFAPVAPILLCVDSWEHWVCVAGGCGPRVWLLDSTREPWNQAGLGRWALTPKSVLRRWRAARRLRGEGGLYYGIAVLSANKL